MGVEIVILEAFDLGQLDGLGDRFREIAVPAIPPAHPKMKVVERASRSALALQPEYAFPENLPRDAQARIGRQERERIIFQVWPKTPMPYLGGKTPEQAAKAGGLEIPLRAAVCQFESTNSFLEPPLDFPALRARLKIVPEPEIDPEIVDIDRLHLSRLWRVAGREARRPEVADPIRPAHEALLPQALRNAVRAIVDRPSMLERPEIDRFSIFSDLANLATSHDNRPRRSTGSPRGERPNPRRSRAGTPRDGTCWRSASGRGPRRRSRGCRTWRSCWSVTSRIASRASRSWATCSTWVWCRSSRTRTTPTDMMLDSRRLQAVLMEYGPKVTTASGGLGVSAAKGEIWTPSGPAGGGSGGGLWTPGGAAAPGGEKAKLIIPGR